MRFVLETFFDFCFASTIGINNMFQDNLNFAEYWQGGSNWISSFVTFLVVGLSAWTPIYFTIRLVKLNLNQVSETPCDEVLLEGMRKIDNAMLFHVCFIWRRVLTVLIIYYGTGFQVF